jgi:hypothetical protein
MKQADKAWLERLASRDPKLSGYLYGRDDPDQVFLVQPDWLPANYSYLARWRAHLSLVRIGDKDDGLRPDEIDVLLNSEDTNRKVKVVIFGTEYAYSAQFAKRTRLVKRLQDIGLTYVLEYLGPPLVDPSDGLPFGFKGCVWAWTPLGIAWVRRRMGLEEEFVSPIYGMGARREEAVNDVSNW